MKKILLLVWLANCLAAAGAMASSPSISNPRCEYRKNPVGVDALQPRLSWVVESGGRGVTQSAWQVLVASSPELLKKNQGDLWDSGKVNSDQSIQIEYAGKTPAAGQSCFWKVRVWNQDGQASGWSGPASWTMGLLNTADWKARWIGAPEALVAKSDLTGTNRYAMKPAPFFRKTFAVSKSVKRATAFASALGAYELHLNGRPVDSDVLSPGWTDFSKRVHYFGYDVTAQLKRGENVLGAILGDGWYAGFLAFTHKRHYYGGDPRLLVQLQIEYQDGTSEIIGTDESWKAATGPIRENDLQMGCVYEIGRASCRERV